MSSISIILQNLAKIHQSLPQDIELKFTQSGKDNVMDGRIDNLRTVYPHTLYAGVCVCVGGGGRLNYTWN